MGRATIEKLLGRALMVDDRQTVPRLDDLSPSLLGEARTLARHSPLDAVAFLRHYIVRPRLGDLMDFIDEVLLGSMDPRAWAIRDYLCTPECSLKHILQEETPALIAPIVCLDESRWSRLRPRREDWHSDSTGVPGKLLRRRYDWHGPQNGVTLLQVSSSPLEPVADVDVGMARWSASRIAWAMKDPRDANLVSVENVAHHFDLSSDHLSQAARRSIAGLSRELTELGWSGEAVPGFRGPDEWYTAPRRS